MQKHLIDPTLSPEEVLKLSQADKYPAFFKILLSSPDLLASFFEWTLRDNNLFDSFVYFPKETLLLLKSNLSFRIGTFAKEGVKISREYPKKLYLLIEGRYEPLDNLERVVELKNHYRLTLAEIFEIFKNKEYEGGNLEFMKEGVTNWSPLHLGSWNPRSHDWDSVDLGRRDWFKSLPLFQTLSYMEVKSRYRVDPKPEQWIVSASATRGSRNLDFNNTHAYLEVAIPNGQGRWNYYDFGKLADRFPQNIFELMAMLCRMSPATIAYPDENVYYTFRQSDRVALLLSETEGYRVLDIIAEDLKRARSGNLLYQIETENCAKWVYETLQRAIGRYSLPNLFRMPLLETEAGGVMGAIFRLIAWLPVSLQVPIMALAHIPAGSFQTAYILEAGRRVRKSVLGHEFSSHGYVFLPALLVHRLEAKMMKAIMDRCRRKAKEWVQLGWNRFVKIGLNSVLSKDEGCITLAVWLISAIQGRSFADYCLPAIPLSTLISMGSGSSIPHYSQGY